jgi:hypothetical protein
MAVSVPKKPPIVVPGTVRREAPAGPSDLVMRIIEEAKVNPMTAMELAAENSRLMAYGALQAQKVGITIRNATSRA